MAMRITRTHAVVVAVAVLAGLSIFFIPEQLGDDDTLREQVVETLRAIIDVDTGKINVAVEEGEVTLDGPLPDRESRRIVLEEVKKINGVKRIIDKIVIDAVPAQDE